MRRTLLRLLNSIYNIFQASLTSTKKVPLLAPLFLFQRIKGHIAIQVLTEVSLQ